MGEFIGQIVGIHVAVCRDKRFLGAVLDESKITAPFVLHPNRIEMLGLGAQHHHHLCRLEGGEDIGLVGNAQLVLQSDAGKEDFQTFTGQLLIQLGCQHAVHSTSAVCVAFLVADENVEGAISPFAKLQIITSYFCFLIASVNALVTS